jgi:hypothetical protein
MCAKNLKPAEFVNELSRCQICNTILTLYPVDFNTCPKCGKAVCRQCWGSAWPAKDFSSEACRHIDKVQGPAVSSVVQNIRGPGVDWPKTIIMTILIVIAVSLLIFFWDLLAF